MPEILTPGGSHEQIVFATDDKTGLRCIIAIHSTALGPSLGGVRFRPYQNEDEALADARRLSEAMTYKAAFAGLNQGGGKAVIIGDPATDRSPELLRAFGRVVQSLGGRYQAACDVGTSPADLAIVAETTDFARGLDVDRGGSGDSAELTARGVYLAMTAAAKWTFGTPSLAGRHVAVQGLGKVGERLAETLHADEARLTVADIDAARAHRIGERLGAEVVAPDKIHLVDADIFSPNALGQILDDVTIPRLPARIVVGAANNQLVLPTHAEELARAGIVYVPDFVANAGGIIQIAAERGPNGYDEERARAQTDLIFARVLGLLDRARAEGTDTLTAATRVAQARVAAEGGPTPWLPAL